MVFNLVSSPKQKKHSNHVKLEEMYINSSPYPNLKVSYKKKIDT